MTMNSILKIGDWVKGESPDGELIIGYLDSFHLMEQAVRVKVVMSDNEEAIGKTIQLLGTSVKPLPSSKVANKEQIRSLIDLALATGDEEWFHELTAQLNAMNKLVTDAAKEQQRCF